MNLVKKGNIPEAEDSFKEAASLADSVVDEIAKDVIQTQVIISFIQGNNKKLRKSNLGHLSSHFLRIHF